MLLASACAGEKIFWHLLQNILLKTGREAEFDHRDTGASPKYLL